MNNIKNKSDKAIELVAIKTTSWIGSPASIIFHTLMFIASFVLYFFEIPLDDILLVLTTIVSLEAIYLSIFIQMSVNRQNKKLDDVAEDVGEIQKDVDEIQEDVDEIQKDVDEIQEDVEDIQEEEEKEGEEMLTRIENTLGKLIEEVIELKKQHTAANKPLKNKLGIKKNK